MNETPKSNHFLTKLFFILLFSFSTAIITICIWPESQNSEKHHVGESTYNDRDDDGDGLVDNEKHAGESTYNGRDDDGDGLVDENYVCNPSTDVKMICFAGDDEKIGTMNCNDDGVGFTKCETACTLGDAMTTRMLHSYPLGSPLYVKYDHTYRCVRADRLDEGKTQWKTAQLKQVPLEETYSPADLMRMGLANSNYKGHDDNSQKGQVKLAENQFPGECTVDETRSCGTDLGKCVKGTQVCLDTGKGQGIWSECGGTFVEPSTEVCDGIDNDCDGDIDENLLNACGMCGPLPIETCDNEDNNCNGAVDEDCL